MGSLGGARVVVGVTGHRDLAEPDVVSVQVDSLLDELDGTAAGGTTSALTCVSALAEGADRLVAERVLARPGGRLVALLPLEPDDYATDFGDAASVTRFNDLLAAADEVSVIAADPTDATREGAYERAGTAMLARVEALAALWDEQPAAGRGGTADVVAEARRRGVDVRVIRVERRRGRLRRAGA